MKSTTTPLLTRCLSGVLAVLMPLQLTLSCAPPGRGQESLSRVQGSKTDLQFDTQKSDTSTDTSPGEGWGDGSDGNGEARDFMMQFGPEWEPGFRIEPAFKHPSIDYGEVYVPLEGTDLKLKASPPEKKGEPPQIEITLGAPSNPDKNDDEGKRPSFPLNPGKLKTKPEALKDVEKRLTEREKTTKERKGTLGKQVAESEAKQKQAPPGALGKAVGAAQGEHGQAAGDIKGSLEKTVADATSGSDTPPPPEPTGGTDTGPGLPPNGIPGARGEKLARTRERANEAAAADKNPFSKDLAKAAKGLLDDAEKKAREGNPNKADEKEKEARRLVDLAGIPPENMPPKRPKGEPPPGPGAPIGERRGAAMGVGLDLYDAADDLTEAGLPELGEKTRKAAAIAIDVAIGVARFSAFFDVPFSVMEAFGNVTLDVDDDGNPYLREPTGIERSIAVVSLGLIAGSAVLGGGVGGVVAAGVIGKMGKVIRGAEKTRALEKAALEAAEKGLVGAEKEALERAAAEAAEENVDDIIEAATDAGTRPPKTGRVEKPEKLAELGKEFDRNGFTKAGRAIQKHQKSSRPGTGSYPKIKGRPEAYNNAGQDVLESILNDSAAVSTSRHHAKRGYITEIKLPDGRGARFGKDGFMGFLDPRSVD